MNPEYSVSFFSEDISFSYPFAVNQLTSWMKVLAQHHGVTLHELNYIFCKDEYLHKINLEYLNHDTYTDIITFDQSEEDDQIQGDIYISIERVKENAATFNTTFENEWLRVIAHGFLHLVGFGDKSEEEAILMREKEEEAIAVFPNN